MNRCRNLIITRLVLRDSIPLRAIGEFFGLTGERVRQLVLRICSEHIDVGRRKEWPHYYIGPKSHIGSIKKHKNRIIEKISKELVGVNNEDSSRD